MRFGPDQVVKPQWHTPGKGMDDIQQHLGPTHAWLIHEDDHLLAVNKPAGLRTIVDGYDPGLPFLAGLLNPQYGRLWIVHRLDKDTSGILLLARDPETHRNLNLQFTQRSITKTYHALVSGIPQWQEKLIDLPLLINGDRRHRTIASHPRGKPASSLVRLLAQFPTAALVSVHPQTGYTHQIRAHLAAVGCPILFDPLYRRSSDAPYPDLDRPTRLALHAFSIEFSHPFSGKTVRLDAPYPEEFSEMIAALKLG
jgi:tRNA pseudouridine32 synthase / 23S rRNA pseudouridine746 synthase